MGKKDQLPLLEGGEKKGGYYPNRQFPGDARESPGAKGNQQFAPGLSGRKGEEHKLSPQLAPAATYPRAAAPSGTLLSFARRARALPGHPGRRRGRAWTFAPSCPWKPQPVHKLRDGAGGGAEPGRQGAREPGSKVKGAGLGDPGSTRGYF